MKSKSKNTYSLIIISLIGLVVILLLQLYGAKYLDLKWIAVFTNIFTAIVASMLASIYYEIFIRQDANEELLQKLNVNKSIQESGIKKYYSNFKDIDLKPFFDTSQQALMYMNFGTTLINLYSDKIEKFLSKKGNKIEIYILSEKNEFIKGLGAHWGYNDDRYNKNGITKKIKSTKETLKQTVANLEKKGNLNGKIKIYEITRHPVFYSFFKFDSTLIFCPSKIAESKNIVPIGLIVENTGTKSCIYKKCLDELDSIHQDKDALKIFYEN